MASSIKYGFNAIIPAPIVNISKSYGRTGSQQKVGSVFNITLTGSVIPDKGSPNSSGVFSDSPTDEALTDNMGQIMLKQEHLRQLFSTDGLLLEINPCNPVESGSNSEMGFGFQKPTIPLHYRLPISVGLMDLRARMMSCSNCMELI
jgi:hypothetical protein